MEIFHSFFYIFYWLYWLLTAFLRGRHLHTGHVGAGWSVSEQCAPTDSLHQSDPPPANGGGGGGAALLSLPGHRGRVPAPSPVCSTTRSLGASLRLGTSQSSRYETTEIIQVFGKKRKCSINIVFLCISHLAACARKSFSLFFKS